MRFGKEGQVIDLSIRPKRIPGDIGETQPEALDIFRYKDYSAMFTNSAEEMNEYELLKIITRIEQERFNLETLGNAFTPLTVTVGTTPTLLLPTNKVPRGYLFLNPSVTVTGITTDFTFLPLISRGAGTATSASFNMQGVSSLGVFLNITVAPTTLSINTLTQDPVSGNFAVSQSNIFAGVTAPGTYYVNVGALGLDDFFEIQAVSTGTGTWSVGGVSKNFGSTVQPPSLFLGNANVTTAIGYPILGGQEKRFLLMDNTPLFGIAVSATPIRIFQLQ